MKKYSTNKDSRIQWIGKIPEHWEIRRLKSFADFINRGNAPSYVENGNIGVINQATFSSGQFDLSKLRFTEDCDLDATRGKVIKNDVLLASTGGGVLGKTALFDLSGEYMADSHVTIIRDSKERFSPKYLYFVLSSNYDLINGILAQGSTNQTELQRVWLNDFKIPFPKKEEQTAIANFLDQKTSEIDQLITTKEELIQKLEVQRKAIINETVTGQAYKNGLIPFPSGKKLKYKDSNIEWLREIPEHWNVERLKYLSSITTGNKDTENKEDDGLFPFFVRSQKVERISTYSFNGEAILTAGDGVGVCKVWHYVNEKFDFHQRVYMLYNLKKIKGLLLFNFLRENFIHDVLKRSAKSTVDSLRLPMFQNFPVAYPPSIEEQNTIINFIEDIDRTFIDLIKKEMTTIEKLKQYKQSLISEAVTGKIDVREWQMDEINKNKNL